MKRLRSFNVLLIVLAVAVATGAFVGGEKLAQAGIYNQYVCTGTGPACPGGNLPDDGGACLTCRVTGAAKICTDYYVPWGCGGWHVCAGACGGAGGTPCTYTWTGQRC
ncbi:MAG: hypothetical protein AB8B50_04065 [Pirellulaceae bacterium]